LLSLSTLTRHNTPSYQASQAGPFDQWPNGMGFDYFYGFVGGDASQWQPNQFRNTTAIFPFRDNPGWNLQTAIADEAIHYMKQLKEIAPGNPWFVYYVPVATHAPHHPTPEWIKKISDMHLFDKGWNNVRETILANQKHFGIMPDDARLTPWPDSLPKLDSLSWEKRNRQDRQADLQARTGACGSTRVQSRAGAYARTGAPSCRATKTLVAFCHYDPDLERERTASRRDEEGARSGCYR
jgi:arylsulfatase A-like enzyme